MSYPKFLDFPESEYKRRYDAVKKLMSARGIQALLISGRENLIYFTGYRTELYASKFRPFVGILPLDGEPVMLVPDLERWGCVQTTWIRDVRHWGAFLDAVFKDAISSIVDLLKEMGLGKATLAAEIGPTTRLGMSLLEFEKIRAEFPKIKFVDASEITWSVRSIKTEEEVTRVKKACQITDKAVEAAWDTLKENVSEKQLSEAIQVTMATEGADRLGFLVIRSGFARGNMVNPLPSDYRIRRGDIVTVDLGAIYGDYWSDMTRNAIMGQPTERARKVHEVVLKAQVAAMNMIRAGVKAKDVDAAAAKILKDAGHGPWMLHRTGHSIGVDLHELPGLGPLDETILQDGMILAVEPGLYPLMYMGDIGNFLNEDIVVVRKSGCDILTNSPRDLYVKT